MPSNDLKSHATLHSLHQGGSLLATYVSASFDLSKYSSGALVTWSVIGVGTAEVTVKLQSSADGVTTWSSRDEDEFVEPVGTPNTHRVMFVHPTKVGPWCRIVCQLIGGATLVGGAVMAVGVGDRNGIHESNTLSIDTGS